MAVTRPCRYCGGQVTSENPECDFCEFCWYDGTALNEQWKPLLDDIGHRAEAYHTGGNCWVLEVPTNDEHTYLWVTRDQDAGLPETEDGPWWVFETEPESDDPGGDKPLGEHLDRAGLIKTIHDRLARA